MYRIRAYVARAIIFAFIPFGAAALLSCSHAAPLFENKTITLTVPSGAGGSYDLYTRILARHYNKHIPGHPTIKVSNMPGGRLYV